MEKYRELMPNELEALRAFAAQFGKRHWQDKLMSVYWYNARIFTDRNGKQWPELHSLRNEFGPVWLCQFKFPEEKQNG